MTSANFQIKFNQAWTARREGRPDEVQAIVDEYLPKAETSGDLEGQALMLKLQAQLQSDRGEMDHSLSTYKRIEKLFIELGDVDKQMHALRHIGMLFLELNKAECAEKCLIQVVDHYSENPTDTLEKANALRLYALALEGMSKNSEALSSWQETKALYQKVGIEEGVAECEEHINGLS